MLQSLYQDLREADTGHCWLLQLTEDVTCLVHWVCQVTLTSRFLSREHLNPLNLRKCLKTEKTNRADEFHMVCWLSRVWGSYRYLALKKRLLRMVSDKCYLCLSYRQLPTESKQMSVPSLLFRHPTSWERWAPRNSSNEKENCKQWRPHTSLPEGKD